jgi:hypothetical protein
VTWLSRLKALREELESLPEGSAKAAGGAYGSFGSASGVCNSDSEAVQAKPHLHHGTRGASMPKQAQVSESLRRGTAKTAISPDAVRLRDAFEERAAIVDFGGVVPRTEATLKPGSTTLCLPPGWIAGVARLADMPPPLDWPPRRWPVLIEDAESFLERWATQAHRLGWQTWELWGRHQRKPWGSIQGMGLVLLLQGDEIAALTATEAVIRTPTGAHQTYGRRPVDPLHPAERCLVWEASEMLEKSLVDNRSARFADDFEKIQVLNLYHAPRPRMPSA